MADQAMTPISVAGRDAATAAISPTALTAANDGVLTPTSDKMILIFTDTGGAGVNVLIKHGSGVLGNQGDITVVLGANETKAIALQSSRVKAMVAGDHAGAAGKIRIDVDANTNAYALSF